MISKEKLLYVVVLAFAFGVALSSFLDGRGAFIFFFGSLAVTLISGVVLFFKRNIFAVTFFVFAIASAAGFFRNELTLHLNNRPTALDYRVKEKVMLTGTLVEEQERRDFNTRLTLRVGEMNDEKILVTTANPKKFRYGDVVRVRGELSRPENFYTETGREFDYVGYLEASDIRFLIRNASVEMIGHDPPNALLSALYFAKRKFVESLGRMLPEPHSSLAAGILIDGKQSINGELQEKFQKTGLIHIVVLSGSNVSIVATAIGQAFSFLPRALGLVSASVGIVMFALITGATATVVRASIMAIIALLSKFSLRRYDPARGLFIASFFMLVHNPSILNHSPSFQLSFLATFAVVKVVPFVESGRAGWIVQKIPERLGLRELISSNIIVQGFLFPILTWMTGYFSAVSLPVNILVLPFVPLTMLASFLTGLSGFGPWFLSLPFAFGSEVLLRYELAVVDFFAGLSFAQISFSAWSGWFVAVLYVTLISFFCIRRH